MNAEDFRVPFQEAISEPRLLANRWKELSLPQQTTLKALYGLSLSDSVRDDRNWSELDYWFASQGRGTFDELGYLLAVDRSDSPIYSPEEFNEAWLNEGVRSGKSSIASFIVCYEATCGGHEAFLRQGRVGVCFQVAQDLRQAKYALHDIVANLEGMSFLGKDRIKAVTADRISLWNNMVIATTPPTVKSVRGYDSPVAVQDEVAIWYQDADSANPDFEIYRQLKSRQAQFNPSAVKLVGISSPWNKGGLLWQRCKAGTRGLKLRCDYHQQTPLTEGEICPKCQKVQRPHRRHMVMTLPTAAINNPLVSKQWLEEQQSADPRAFRRECLAEFLDSVSGFLDADLLHAAVARGVVTRPPVAGITYVAAMDPAFRRDSFAFCVGHVEHGGKVVYDYLKREERAPGAPPLNPAECLKDVATHCHAYGLSVVFTDQYHIESLAVIAQAYGLAVSEVNFQSGSKAEIYANLASLLNQRKLSLLDNEDGLNELLSLERSLQPGGGISISAPSGLKDDLATVQAIVAKQCQWLYPAAVASDDGTPPGFYPDDGLDARPMVDVIREQVAQKWAIREVESGDMW